MCFDNVTHCEAVCYIRKRCDEIGLLWKHEPRGKAKPLRDRCGLARDADNNIRHRALVFQKRTAKQKVKPVRQVY